MHTFCPLLYYAVGLFWHESDSEAGHISTMPDRPRGHTKTGRAPLLSGLRETWPVAVDWRINRFGWLRSRSLPFPPAHLPIVVSLAVYLRLTMTRQSLVCKQTNYFADIDRVVSFGQVQVPN